MASYSFGDVAGGVCRPCPGDEPDALSERLDLLIEKGDPYVPFTWEFARECGFVHSREEYVGVLRSLCTMRAEKELGRIAGTPEMELVYMVRMLDQIDEAANLLTGRALEWHAAKDPAFSRKFRELRGQKAREVLAGSKNPVLSSIATEMAHLSEVRSALSREITALAADVMPNTSGLVGGVVAARLLSGAGGLSRLARLPGATIQVMGARLALFSHLRSGTPPPKHGIIYQHRRVHAAGKARRGKVSRTLAAKLAIAARIDYYRGRPDPGFLESAGQAIDRAGGRR